MLTQQLDSEEVAWIKSMFAQWKDAPVVEPQGPLVSGWLADVNTGDFIATDWGNTVRNRSITPFANAAARDAALPVATAPLGSYCVTLDNGAIWELNDRSGARRWTPPWNMPWGWRGSVTSSTAMSGITNAVMMPGLDITVPVVSNRRYRVMLSQQAAYNSLNNTGAMFSIVQDTLGIKSSSVVWPVSNVGSHFGMEVDAVVPAGAASSRFQASVGYFLGGTVGINNAGQYAAPSSLSVYDVGPSNVIAIP